MIDILTRILPALLVIVLIVNLMQRGLTDSSGYPDTNVKRPRVQKRRTATLTLSGLILATWLSTLLLQYSGITKLTGAILMAVTVVALIGLRSRITVFPLHCRFCGACLPFGIILGTDAKATIAYENGCCPCSRRPD